MRASPANMNRWKIILPLPKPDSTSIKTPRSATKVHIIKSITMTFHTLENLETTKQKPGLESKISPKGGSQLSPYNKVFQVGTAQHRHRMHTANTTTSQQSSSPNSAPLNFQKKKSWKSARKLFRFYRFTKELPQSSLPPTYGTFWSAYDG